MPPLNCPCGRMATAGRTPTNRPICINCASEFVISLPAIPETKAKAPEKILKSKAWNAASSLVPDDLLWLHQANSLNQLIHDENIVIATPTASGKSLVFQLWTLYQQLENSKATALIFYPTKALANDQLRRWQEANNSAGLPQPTSIKSTETSQSTTETKGISTSRIILMTPDVCHAWLTRNTNKPQIENFLKNLSTIIIDEGHTYDSTFGSNAAYLFRRLIAAAHNSGNPNHISFISATATILDPEEHLTRLTGQPFVAITDEQNGAPRYTRNLYHLPPIHPSSSKELQMAQAINAILDNDPESQVIAFHDSRQGIERIAQYADRPNQVKPYRSGYTPQERRQIENELRSNKIRAVVTTSALELGIDMPDLNYGLTLDLPPTRSQFHQRLGRVGRSRPGNFIILAPKEQFTKHGETLRDYYENSVEPSRLYLANEYIAYQHALCLADE